ncbi:MAG: hypothetical protein ACRDD1_05940, partial [Planctomycetia bacterium]
ALTILELGPRDKIARLIEQPDSEVGMTKIVVQWTEPILGAVELDLHGTLPISTAKPNGLKLPTAAVDPGGQGTVEVYRESNVRLTPDPAMTRNLFRQPLPSAAAGPVPQNRSSGENPVPLWFFRHQLGVPVLGVSVQRLPRRVEADVTTAVRLAENDLLVQQTIAFRSLNEPIDQLVLRVPPGVEGLTIQDRKATAADGLTAVLLPQPAEAGELSVKYRVAPSAADVPAAERPDEKRPAVADSPGVRRLSVPLVRPNDAEVRSCRIEVWCDRPLRAEVVGPWSSGTPRVDRLDAAAPAPAAVAVIQGEPPDALELRFEPAAPMASLVCPRVVVEETIGADGRRRGWKRLLVAKHRTDAARFALPLGCEIVLAFIDGEPRTVTVGGDRIATLALPTSDRPFSLEICYEYAAAPRLGAIGVYSAGAPPLVGDAAVEDVRWLIQTCSDQLLLGGVPGDGVVAWSDLSW